VVLSRWRAERREADLKKEILVKKEMLTNSRKKWTLDEDGDDDEEPSVPDPADQEEGKEGEAAEDGVDGEKEVKPPVKMEVEEDEEDPLDAFMKTVQAEVRKVNVNNGGKNETSNVYRECKILYFKFLAVLGGNDTSATNAQGVVNKVVIMKAGTAKKKTENKNKGELVEQNQDGLEVQ